LIWKLHCVIDHGITYSGYIIFSEVGFRSSLN
jgi:hypothetical protein